MCPEAQEFPDAFRTITLTWTSGLRCRSQRHLFLPRSNCSVAYCNTDSGAAYRERARACRANSSQDRNLPARKKCSGLNKPRHRKPLKRQPSGPKRNVLRRSALRSLRLNLAPKATSQSAVASMTIFIQFERFKISMRFSGALRLGEARGFVSDRGRCAAHPCGGCRSPRLSHDGPV